MNNIELIWLLVVFTLISAALYYVGYIFGQKSKCKHETIITYCYDCGKRYKKETRETK